MTRRLAVFDSKTPRTPSISTKFPSNYSVKYLFPYLTGKKDPPFSIDAKDILIVHIGRCGRSNYSKNDYELFCFGINREKFLLPDRKEDLEVYAFTKAVPDGGDVDSFEKSLISLGLKSENIVVCTGLPPCRSIHYLPALTILCQAYLAAHEGRGLAKWDRVPQKFRNLASARSDTVTDTAWWKRGLPNSKNIIIREFKAASDSNRNVESSPTYTLINVLFKNDKIEDIELVEKAFSDLSDLLLADD